MTINKLARLLVEDFYSGAPGDEGFMIAVEHMEKRLRATYTPAGFGTYEPYVQVTIENPGTEAPGS
jgi:hypothetical protein